MEESAEERGRRRSRTELAERVQPREALHKGDRSPRLGYRPAEPRLPDRARHVPDRDERAVRDARASVAKRPDAVHLVTGLRSSAHRRVRSAEGDASASMSRQSAGRRVGATSAERARIARRLQRCSAARWTCAALAAWQERRRVGLQRVIWRRHDRTLGRASGARVVPPQRCLSAPPRAPPSASRPARAARCERARNRSRGREVDVRARARSRGPAASLALMVL